MTTSTYEVQELNPLPKGSNIHSGQKRSIDWDDPELKEITRLRLLSDPGLPWWDVSYCYGETQDGEAVNVNLPFAQLPKKGMRRAIVLAAKKDGVFAKGLRIFDNLSTLC